MLLRNTQELFYKTTAALDLQIGLLVKTKTLPESRLTCF